MMFIQKSIVVFFTALVYFVSLCAANNGYTPKFQFVDPSVTPPIKGDIFGLDEEEGYIDVSVFPGRILNVEVTYEGYPTPKCVAIYYNGKLTRREKSPPFMMFGNAAGPVRAGVPPIYGREIPTGTQRLKACAFDNADCKTAPLGCEEISFFVEDTCANPVNFFEVFDAVTKEPKGRNPSTIFLSDFFNGRLNIKAYAENNTCGKPPIGCVKMTFGSVTRKETLPPYELYSASGGIPALGTNKLSACTYTDIHCKYGKQGCREIEVKVEAEPY